VIIQAPTQRIETDFVVVGAGLAGLRATAELAKSGRVLIIAKDSLLESSSEYAQGGIAVALSDDDELELHEQDTIVAGDGLCDLEAVKVLVEEGPAAIEQLIEWGTDFDRKGDELLFGREGAHSRSRILHAHGDSTGHEIVRSLRQHAASLPNVSFHSFATLVDLLVSDGRVVGITALDGKSGETAQIFARGILLATGGMGRIFANTTNPDVATGDGVACAFRAGAGIGDIEFIQFHPTALYIPGAPRFLLSEALRGEGAYLRNGRGERFMDRYHPLEELAPRDVVSRSIVAEMGANNDENAFLDVTHLPAGFVRNRFPRIYQTCLTHGIDLERAAAPVRPAAHYSMGGIRTDLFGQTNLSRLFAAGEAACTGVHGANRLASNSLLEAVVFGARAGRAMAELSAVSAKEPVISPVLIPEISEFELRELTWNGCGILRDKAGLSAALNDLGNRSLKPCAIAGRPELELRNMHQVGWLIARAALAREESRGAHFRRDFPQKSPRFEKHSLLHAADGNFEARLQFV
jgi:L-aspartate oxidase